MFGIGDDNLEECLLRETDILLSKLVGLAQRTESSKQHIREMTGATTKSMDAIHKNIANRMKSFMQDRFHEFSIGWAILGLANI